MSAVQIVTAAVGRTGSGIPIPPPAGATVVANGTGGATWGATASAPGILVVYVSLAGSNSNDGLTIATAVQTLAAAIAIVTRRGWNISTSIRLLPGTYNLPGGGILRSDGIPGLRPTVLTIESNSLDLLGSYPVASAAIVGNLVEITIATPVPLAADCEQVRFTSGALNGRRAIVGNVTGTTFTAMLSDAPAPGDTFVLEATTATINFANGTLLTGGIRLLRNLKVILPPQDVTTIQLLLVDMTLLLSGVQFVAATSAGAFIVLTRSTVAAGSNAVGIPGVEANPIGFVLKGNGAPNLGMICYAASALSLQGCYFRDAQILATNGGSMSMGQTLCQGCACIATDGAVWTADQSRYLNAPGDGLSFTAASARLSAVDISNSGGSGVNLAGTDLRLDTSVTSIVPNADAGVRIDGQGRVVASGAGAGVTITGVANPDVIVGVNAPATWADLAAGVAPHNDYAAPLSRNASVATV
jgi:hypothetical protein